MTYYCSVEERYRRSEEWQVKVVECIAKVVVPEHKLRQVGAALGGKENRVQQLRENTAVVRAMHEN